MTSRPLLAGPDSLTPPYPVLLKGAVCKGFGRGSKDLGIPTANLPEQVAQDAGDVLDTGIYYGWAAVGQDPAKEGHVAVHPMVMSYGWNPYYKNEKRSAVEYSLFPYKRMIRSILTIITALYSIGGAHYPQV